MNNERKAKGRDWERSYQAPQSEELAGEPTPPSPAIFWDIGTAYDLFFSLYVLHQPEKFGLRPSWAAGVRSRLSIEERQTLLESQSVIHIPLHWIYTLPSPKDAESVLWTLRQLPLEERLLALSFGPKTPDTYKQLLTAVARRGSWDEQDMKAIKDIYREMNKDVPRPKELRTLLDVWSNPAEFGERYLEALQSYYRAFFAEEQLRIQSALRTALAQAEELAERLPVPELIEELSKGIHVDEYLDVSKLILAPSYWITPLLHFSRVEPDAMLMVFGARPADASLVPGEQIPDQLLLGLKALSDPTRLRILRYLTHERLTPAELARRLRLRAPTLTHHLRALRLAGLVHISLGAKKENLYSARLESIDDLSLQIKGFLERGKEPNEGEERHA